MERTRVGRLACMVMATLSPAAAGTDPVFSATGRLNFGSVWRLEAPDARFLLAQNGAAAGVAAFNGTGANVDDGNLNFRRHDAVSRAATGLLELRAAYRGTRARLDHADE